MMRRSGKDEVEKGVQYWQNVAQKYSSEGFKSKI
jgi:hypothetical protein